MEISKEEKLRILNLHESYKEYHGTIIKEQYQPDNSGGRGGTSASSAGQYISGGAWDQKGPFFKSQRKTPETEVKEVDITGGNQEYQGYTKGLSIDQIPTDNQSPGNNIESTDDIGPQYSIVNTQDNRNPYDGDNPDPYDKQRPDPKKGKSEKEWRSPPCCIPCGGGKWKHDCGELERAPGSKQSNSTGCIYNSYSDCQLAGKSVNEHAIGNGSGFVDNQGRSASLDKFTRRQQEMSEEGFDPESKYGIPGTEGGHQVDPDRDKKMTAKELTLAILKALGKENDPVQSIIEAVIEKQFQMRVREGEERWW